MVTPRDVYEAGRLLGIRDQALCIHSSFRSFGAVDGGPAAIVNGLVSCGCTVMAPTFSWCSFAIPPPPGMHPARNGCDYELPPDVPMPGIDRVYRPETDEIDALSMGAIPAALVRMPGRARGNHPLGSLSAVGPLAQQLISTQGPMDAFGPLQALACVEGWVVLMGVGLTSMTLLHLAEKLSGRTLFRRWANDANGEPMEVEIGGCSDGFGRFEPTLAHLARATTVGRSLWRAFPAGETLSAAADAVRADPALTHCGRPGCGRCNDAVAGGPMLT